METAIKSCELGLIIYSSSTALDKKPNSIRILGIATLYSTQKPACFTVLSIKCVFLTRFFCTLSASIIE